MSDQCHCPEQGLDETCGMCRFESERDRLKAELDQLKRAAKEASRTVLDQNP
jgi:hypothetical protein